MAEEKTDKSGSKVVQVVAAALAAITAALLGSTLGVAGTLVGAGLASVVTTVGGEMYLRSLHRTREAAKSLATRRLDPAERPTVVLPLPDGRDPEERKRGWKRRWPMIAGVSAVAFAIAIATIIGFEGATGKTFGGGQGTTIGKIVGGGAGSPGRQTKETPTTSETTPPPSTPSSTTTPPSSTTTPSAPPTSTTPPTTTTPPSPSNTPTPTPSAPVTTPSRAS